MQLNIDNKKWLYRQSFLMQMIVFCGVLFIASLLANLVTGYLFDGSCFFKKSGHEIDAFLQSRFFKALILGVIITVLIRSDIRKLGKANQIG